MRQDKRVSFAFKTRCQRDRILAATAVALSLLNGCGGGGGGDNVSPLSAADNGPATAIQEVVEMQQSADPTWWVNSGGVFYGNPTGGRTIEGDVPPGDPWHQRYAARNPRDTDGGAHPQNVFRVIRRSVLANPHQQMTFHINAIHASASPNRNESNGVFLISHFVSGNRLYSVGVRVDGAAVIKKTAGSQYVTLGYRQIFAGAYDRGARPNLIPTDRDVELASDAITAADGSVMLRLSVDGDIVLEAVDHGSGDSPIAEPGFVGIATDFMDVEFQGYEAGEISP